MKILYICSDAGIPVLGRKGASVHVREMCAAFARSGCRVVLAASSLTKSPWDEPAEVAAQIIRCPLSSAAQSAIEAVKNYVGTIGAGSGLGGELRRILGSETLVEELIPRFKGDPPDFIYERASLFGTAGVRLAREWNIPLLVEMNAPLVAEHSVYRDSGLGSLAMEAEQHTIIRADAVFAVSALLREHVLILGADAGRVHVLPNGVDPALFCPAPRDELLRARLGLKPGPVLGFLGGLRPWHGVEILPELLGRMVEVHDNVQLVIAGDGPMREELEREFGARGVAGRVLFTGNVPHDEIPGIVRLFDVALAPYPALDHAFYFSPLKVFEYMACGVAVVASHCGQIAEVVHHGENGLLVPAGNVEATVTACERLLRDSELRARLGAAASSLIRARYTWDSNAAKIMRVGRELIASRSANSHSLCAGQAAKADSEDQSSRIAVTSAASASSSGSP